MFNRIYIEHDLYDHPLARSIISRAPGAAITECGRYTEVFNRKSQNFRLQKRDPALVLARKHDNHVLPAPGNYAIGASRNFYFSHMLNCLYDCRYCFLQGMYRSANYVLFVNYADFRDAIDHTIASAGGEPVHFFSGYDCDSLALEPVTGFVQDFLPFFRARPGAVLELRTKSTQIRQLLEQEPATNCVVAWSLSPEAIVEGLEHRTPSLEKRLQAITTLQNAGWPIGLRFDPVIYSDGFRDTYHAFFRRVFSVVDPGRLHSVSLGSFRLPQEFFRSMSTLYPDEPLFATRLQRGKDRLVGYHEDIRAEMIAACEEMILSHVPEVRYFPCDTGAGDVSDRG